MASKPKLKIIVGNTKLARCVAEYQSICKRLGWPTACLKNRDTDPAKSKALLGKFELQDADLYSMQFQTA